MLAGKKFRFCHKNIVIGAKSSQIGHTKITLVAKVANF
jgi:hypothetical protein